MSTTITARDVIREVRALAAEYPDAVYMPPYGSTTCYYTRGTAGNGVGCLIGQALMRVGVPSVNLRSFDKGLYPSTVEDVLDQLGISANARSLEWLYSAQGAQDSCNTWRDAVAEAQS